MRDRTTSSGAPIDRDPSPPPGGAPSVGSRLGRYRLVEELGAGGMATVYRAEDTTLRREVAVKVLHPHLARKTDYRGRFLREARAAAKLDHPNILRVFDVGGEDDPSGAPAWIVMELLRGRSLKELLDERGAPLAEIAALVGAALADALSVAHRAGIVHRDVKPSNVMIVDGGRLVLCDFGVARLADDDAILTHSGMMVGTPAFMSPEQALGKEVDARSDVYSLGATLYQLSTGWLPATGPTPAVLAAISKGDLVPPLRRNPAIGVDLARVITKAMSHAPADRYASADALRDALMDVASASGLTDRAAELTSYFADPGAWNEGHTDAIVATTMKRAKQAASTREFARALALADRVLALRPSDEDANALVAAVGGGARRWRAARLVAAVVAVGVMGVGVVFVWKAVSSEGAVAAIASDAMMPQPSPANANANGPANANATGPANASATGPANANATDPANANASPSPTTTSAKPTIAKPRPTPDPSPVPDPRNPDPRNPDPRNPDPRNRHPGNPDPRTPDPPPALDAGPPPPPEDAYLTVKIPGWCEIEIDGSPRGRAPTAEPLRVPPGKRSFRCHQPGTGNAVTRTLDLSPGERVTITDSLLVPVDVTIAIPSASSIRIDGTAYKNGATLRLEQRRHLVEILDGGRVTAHEYVSIKRRCTLRREPQLACYETP